MDLEFSWDDDKAERNRRKHDVSFEEAKSVFRDPFAVVVADPRHSRLEDRWLIVGWSVTARPLTVTFTWRGVAIRIISARMATRHERREIDRRRP
jgi:hypothetical protein